MQQSLQKAEIAKLVPTQGAAKGMIAQLSVTDLSLS